MEVGQGPNVGCIAKGKKMTSVAADVVTSFTIFGINDVAMCKTMTKFSSTAVIFHLHE
jgi:hypothetical protein